MIAKDIEKFCKEYWKIENYDKAINDTTKTWICHHRLEIMPYSGKIINYEYLIKQNMYYDRLPEELIFVTKSEHNKVHRRFLGKHHTLETKEKMSSSHAMTKGSKLAKEQSERMKGRHWYNNGIKEKLFFEENVPEGWVKGRKGEEDNA